MRFTSRDPVRGNQQEPLTLHKYLYCLNNPVDMTDLNGQSPVLAMRLFSSAVGAAVAGGVAYATGADRQAIGAAIVSGLIGGYSMNMWVSATMGAVSSGFTTYLKGGGADMILRNASLGFMFGVAGGSYGARFSGSVPIDSWTATLFSAGGNLYGGLLDATWGISERVTQSWYDKFWEGVDSDYPLRID
jgi:hypothetical protein